MSDKGILAIEVEAMQIDEDSCRQPPWCNPGHFFCITVSDTGSGMDQATQAKIFDPFFTTKSLGKGTGLGLSTVYGIVKQNNGSISVYSEPGQGTTFSVCFPAAGAIESLTQKPKQPQRVFRGNETILYVEDEQMLLEIGVAILEDAGYTVLAANSPKKALQMSDDFAGEIDLMVSDMIMPEMSGKELCQHLLEKRPNMKTLSAVKAKKAADGSYRVPQNASAERVSGIPAAQLK